MIPAPGFIVDSVGQWLKIAVSTTTVDVLALLGYPVAQTGVIIQIDQYQLLVADACAGMRTLLMLEMLGILYLYMIRYPSVLRNVVLPLLIVPISFAANVIRVLLLALVTYYFGDTVGQGYLHELAGVTLFATGIGLMIAADGALRLPQLRASAP